MSKFKFLAGFRNVHSDLRHVRAAACTEGGKTMDILKVTDKAFCTYGKVVNGIDFSDLAEAMQSTPVPAEGVVYKASEDALERCTCAKQLCRSGFGGMPIQIGYCNGKNHKLNAVEYHRDSEINVAATDCILLLGRVQDIGSDLTYDTAKVQAFLIPAGTAVELYATTLHYAPCNVGEDGFRVAIVLPRGTNTDIDKAEAVTAEDKLLYAKNKWLIAHPDAGVKEAFAGLVGENPEVSVN